MSDGPLVTVDHGDNGVLRRQVLAGTFRVEKVIGGGGMGEVYEAAHTRLPRRLAIKALYAHVATDADAVDRFQQEAWITSELGHPHIVTVCDFNHTPEGLPYIVMELLEGENLEERLQQVGRLALPKVGDILTQAASALQAAHERGIVHRDLKPQNLFLARHGEQDDYVKLLDFGISKVRSSRSIMTHSHIIIGTPWYMAPEQARGRGDQVDRRADIFATGVMLYEMIAGQKPFTGDTPDAVLYQVVHEEPLPLRVLRPEVPLEVEQVVQRAMAKDPFVRFDTMLELAASFNRAISRPSSLPPRLLEGPPRKSSTPVGFGPPVGEPPAPKQPPRRAETPAPPRRAETPARSSRKTDGPAATMLVERRRKNRWPLVALAVLAGFGVLTAVCLLTHRPSSRASAQPAAIPPGHPEAHTPRRDPRPTPTPAPAQPTPTEVKHNAPAPQPKAHRTGAAQAQPRRVRRHDRAQAQAQPRRVRRHEQARGVLRVATLQDGMPLVAQVFVDDQYLGQSPLQVQLDVGPHRLEAIREGYEVSSRTIQIQKDRKRVVILELRRSKK
jgi:serine/threonine-protein kinase